MGTSDGEQQEPRMIQTEPGLALVVGAARSGTTLLRLILDAHPEIGCPAEAGLPALMAHMVGVWMTVQADVIGRRGEDPGAVAGDEGAAQDGLGVLKDDGTGRRKVPFDELPTDARDWIRECVRGPMRRYTRRGRQADLCGQVA
jgi:hypothetical protein